MIPYLHAPIGTARDEYFGVEWVPSDLIDGHMMRVENVQELTGVSFRAFVNASLFRPNEEQVIGLLVEVERRATTWVCIIQHLQMLNARIGWTVKSNLTTYDTEDTCCIIDVYRLWYSFYHFSSRRFIRPPWVRVLLILITDWFY